MEKLLLTGDLWNNNRRLLKARNWESENPGQNSVGKVFLSHHAQILSSQILFWIDHMAFNGFMILDEMLFPKSSQNDSESHRAYDGRCSYTSRHLFEEINHHNMQHNPAFLGDITII